MPSIHLQCEYFLVMPLFDFSQGFYSLGHLSSLEYSCLSAFIFLVIFLNLPCRILKVGAAQSPF